MYKQIAMGLGAKKLIGAVGDAASGAYGIVSKTGKALGAAGKAIGDVANNDSKQDTQPSNVIVGNFGMAGSAGRQRITGGGTLPAPKTAAKPQVSAKMPTKALLDTVVKYLTSIDKTLKSQIEFDRRALQEQTQVEREAIIESKPSVTFSDIKDRLSGLKSDVRDNVSTAATIAKFALILGGAAALIANAMDQKELDALKENVNQFKKTFGWLGELGAAVGAGGLFGFLFGGKGVTGRLKGGLVGMVAAHVVERLYSSFSGGNKTDEDGNVILDQDGKPVKESRSMSGLGYGLSAIAGGMAIKSIAKRLPAAKLAAQTAGQYGRVAASSSVAGMQAATRKGTSWLASRRGRKFLIILGRKLGKGAFAKIAKYLARIVAGLLMTATGVGAIPGILVILASVAFIGFDIFDIATSIYDAFTESAVEDTTAQAVPAVKETDAMKVAASPVGYSTNRATGGKDKTIASVVDGGPGYTTVTYSDGTTERRGGTIPARTNNPGNIMDGPLARSYGSVGSTPSTNGPPVAVFPTPTHGFAAMDGLLTSKYSGGPIGQTIEAWATDPTHPAKVLGSSGLDPNKKYTDFNKDEKVRFMQSLAKVEGYYAAGSGPTVSSGDSASSGIGGMVNAGAGKLGEVFGMLGSAIIKPGIKRDTFTPSTSNVSEQINNESTKLQNDITFGIKKEKSKDSITMPTISAGKPRSPSPVKSVSSMDPNYGNMDVLTKYLAHFRLAA